MADPLIPFQTHPVDPRERDRRAAVRYPCALESNCQPIPEGDEDTTWAATVRDISTTGIGLVLNRPFLPGTLLSLELSAEDGRDCTLLTEVVHVAPQDSDSWFVGCAFTRELSEAELKELL